MWRKRTGVLGLWLASAAPAAEIGAQRATQDIPIAAVATTTIAGAFDGAMLGTALSQGDFNGDGLVDLVVAAGDFPTPLGNAGNPLAIVFGRTGGLPSSLSLSDLDGDTGFVIAASTVNGGTVAPHGGSLAAGDINGDGIDDLVFSYAQAPPFGSSSSHPAFDRSVVLYGRSSGFPAALDATLLAAGEGVSIAALDPPGLSRTGLELACGDINGDGFDDVLVGMLTSSGVDLSGFVVFGGAALPASIDPSGLDGSNGFRLAGVPVTTLERTAHVAAGDLNGDGIDDLALGVPRAALVRVFFGKSTWPALVAPLDFVAHPGFPFQVRLSNNVGMGGELVFVPDVNGDGRRELLTSAANAEGGRGEAYLLFGFTGATPNFDFDGVSATAVLGDVVNRGLGDALAGSSRGLAIGAGFSDSGRGRVLLLPARPAPWPGVIDGAALATAGNWLTGSEEQPVTRFGSALAVLPADAAHPHERLAIGAPQNAQNGQGAGVEAGRAYLVPASLWTSADALFSSGFEGSP